MLESPIRPAMRSPLQQAIDRIGSAAIWTPATLFAASEQGVWYDPSDFSTLFQDSAGTVPVTATGQVVGKMLDKSGRGNHATQATTASKPILQQDGNGKYYLAFDGVDDGMATAAVDFTATDKMSLFAGLRKTNATAAFNCLLETGNDGVGGFAIFAPDVNNNNYSFWLKANSRALAGTYVAPITNVLTATHDCAQATAALQTKVRVNAQGAAFSPSSASASGNFVNSQIFIGRRGGTSLPFNGWIYQLIIRGALTDAAGITAAETFVNTKTAAY